jgi:threonine dehydrogenase-like Zn-dependent dehydrogenase
VIDWNDEADPVAEILETTSGRGADSVIDAVGMEAHGAPVVQAMQAVVGKLPSRVGAKLMETVGSDRTTVLHAAIDTVRRGGTISLIGVYGGAATPMPMMDLFDKQIQLRMGQANVKAWIDELLPLVTGDADPLGAEDFATHLLPLAEAPHAYEMFQKKQDGAIKIVLKP